MIFRHFNFLKYNVVKNGKKKFRLSIQHQEIKYIEIYYLNVVWIFSHVFSRVQLYSRIHSIQVYIRGQFILAQDEKNYNRFGTIRSVNALGPDGAQLLTENSSGVLHPQQCNFCWSFYNIPNVYTRLFY